MSSIPLYRAVALPADERLRAIRSSLGEFADRMVPASELPERVVPPRISTGISSIDALAGGLPCGALTEIFGPPSSGRTSLLFSTLAELTQKGNACALVDVNDGFDPLSAEKAGIKLRQLLWVRCNGVLARKEPTHVTRYVENDFGTHEAVEVRTDKAESPARAARKLAFRRLEQGLRAADLLLQSGGFSLIALDAADVAVEIARKVPMTTWYRFRRGVESTATTFVLLTRDAIATGCVSLSLRMERISTRKKMVQNAVSRPSHAAVLEGMDVSAEMVRGESRQKKGVQRAEFISSQQSELSIQS